MGESVTCKTRHSVRKCFMEKAFILSEKITCKTLCPEDFDAKRVILSESVPYKTCHSVRKCFVQKRHSVSKCFIKNKQTKKRAIMSDVLHAKCVLLSESV